MDDAQASERTEARWRDIALITALVVLVGVPSLFTRDLWNPDEPRYMEVAREMAVLGDYVIPHLNGKVYSEKPPMFFWLAGLLWRAGLGYNSGRIVTLAAVWGTLLLVYLFCRRRIGPKEGLLAAAIALTCLLLVKFTTIGVLDPLLTFFTTTALIAGYAAFHRASGRSALPLWVGCYVAMGLGTLTKGPVGFLVPGLVLLSYGIFNRKNTKAGGAAHALGFIAFAAVVLAWLIPAILAGGPDYTRTILLKQNVGRAISSYSHQNPFYYYLVRWPMYFFPWSFLLPLAVFAAVRRWRESDRLVRFAFLWLIVPFAFFMLISGKRMNYVLPTAPAVGILVAWYFTSRREGTVRHPRAERWLLSIASFCIAILTVLLMATTLAAPTMVRRLYPEAEFSREIALFLTPSRMAAALAMLAVPVAVSLWGTFRSRASSIGRAAALIAAVVLVCPAIDIFLLPAVNKVKSGRRFGMSINRYATGSKAVYLYGDEFSGVYNLWTGRVSIPALETEDELREKLAAPDALVVSDLKRFKKVLTPEELESHQLAGEHVGHRTMVLLEGRGAGADEVVAAALEAEIGAKTVYHFHHGRLCSVPVRLRKHRADRQRRGVLAHLVPPAHVPEVQRRVRRAKNTLSIRGCQPAGQLVVAVLVVVASHTEYRHVEALEAASKLCIRRRHTVIGVVAEQHDKLAAFARLPQPGKESVTLGAAPGPAYVQVSHQQYFHVFCHSFGPLSSLLPRCPSGGRGAATRHLPAAHVDDGASLTAVP